MKTKDYPAIGERVFYEKLDNGLSIYVVSKPGYAKSRAFFAVNYGGADRRFKIGGEWIDTPAGIAHYLEHKMFDLEEGNALNMFFANGASANAFTSSDMTAYHFECTDNFDENLRLLLRFVSMPYFTEESVAKEQGIISQEIRMVEDNPNYAGYYNLLKLLYKAYPMRDAVAGTVEEIAKITPQTLYSCHKIFYNCVNMALCVIGDVDPDSVVRTALEILPRVRSEMPERDYGKPEGEYPNEHRMAVEMSVGIPLFFAGAKIKRVPSEHLLRQEMTAELAIRLLMGKSSPLYADMYAKGIVNQSFSGEYERIAGQSMIIFGGESKNPEAVVSAVTMRAEQIMEEDISAAFARQKKSLMGKKLRELNSFSDVCYNVVKGCFEGFDPFEALHVIDGITLEMVKEFILETFSKDKIAVSIVLQKHDFA